MFSKILIANRGEIAVRIIRACRELNIRTVAVYSEADKDSLHVELADEAVCIGPGPAQESYLNIPQIISAAEITDSDAIHPGYGFLAENAHFAEICESCGIKFIGPKPENIKLMGDKLEARKLAKKCGVPLVPGSLEKINEKEKALEIAHQIGYPVMLKAVAGGGGRGMRVCHTDMRLVSSFLTCQAEAESSFGDKSLYIEKFIENPRHIEVQIAADKYGNVVSLYERECSIQRRHQKLIEEAPSPIIDTKLRKKLIEWATKLAKACKYENVGTLEFIMDKEQNLYFIEMNTRIQVEHPVTEQITDVDLVKLQILIAAGEKLGLKQEDIPLRGHAIEFRINCEDPEKNFVPTPGLIEFLNLPGGKGVRVDTAIYQGYRVPPFYDSLLAKLICYGKDRKEALKIAKRALSEFMIHPLKTTISLHQRIVSDPDFCKGNYDTSFLSKFCREEVYSFE